MPYKEAKVEKIFFTISEVAEKLNVKQHTIRYWESVFEIENPNRNPKTMRRYSIEEFDVFRKIQHLLKVEKMTIEGAKIRFKERNIDNAINSELLLRLEKVKKGLKVLLNQVVIS